MVLGISVFLLLAIVYIWYLLYIKEFKDLTENYKVLIKVLDTRNLLLLRILPELKDKDEKNRITTLVDAQIKSKSMGINATIESDVTLNKYLKDVYININKIKNPIVIEEFKRIIRLEKSLKSIRREFNKAAEEYNQNLLDHKFVCGKVLKMRPVNSYKLGNE